MKRIGFLMLSLLLLASFARAAQEEPFTEAVAVPRAILEEAAFGFETTEFQVHYVESAGLFRDFFARLARGGEEADRLHARLRDMAAGGGGRILVYGPNPGLAYTVLRSALPEEDGGFSLAGITIGYAGHEQYGDRLCKRICNGEGSFVFINTRVGHTREPERANP